MNMAILSTNPASIVYRRSYPSAHAPSWHFTDDDEPAAPEPAAPPITAPTQADVELLLALQWVVPPAGVDQA